MQNNKLLVQGNFTGELSANAPVMYGWQNYASIAYTEMEAGDGGFTQVNGLRTSAVDQAAYSFVGGHDAKSSNPFTFVWNGRLNNTDEYDDKGAGTFSLNPEGGFNGVYIGNKTIETYTKEASSNASSLLQDTSKGDETLNNIIHKSGNETITGIKTISSDEFNFKSDNNIGSATISHKEIRNIDSNEKQTGYLDFAVGNNTQGAYLCITDNNGIYKNNVGISYDTNGKISTNAPKPSATSLTNDTNIATVGWVNDSTTSTNVVHRDSSETIEGLKTFTSKITVPELYNAISIKVDSSLVVSKNLYVTNSASLGGNLNVKGKIYASSITVSDQKIMVDASLNVSKHLLVTNSASLGGSLNASNLYSNNNLYVSNSASVGSLYVEGKAEFASDINVFGSSSLKAGKTASFMRGSIYVETVPLDTGESTTVAKNQAASVEYVDKTLGNAIQGNFNNPVTFLGSLTLANSMSLSSKSVAGGSCVIDASLGIVKVSTGSITDKTKEDYAASRGFARSMATSAQEYTDTKLYNNKFERISFYRVFNANSYYAKIAEFGFTNLGPGNVLRITGTIGGWASPAMTDIDLNIFNRDDSTGYHADCIIKHGSYCQFIDFYLIKDTTSNPSYSVYVVANADHYSECDLTLQYNDNLTSTVTNGVKVYTNPSWSTVSPVSGSNLIWKYSEHYKYNITLPEKGTSSGSGTVPVYVSSDKCLYQSGSTVGSSISPIYMYNGSLSRITGTVGTNANPVYLKGGSIASCDYKFTDYATIATTQTITGSKTFSSRVVFAYTGDAAGNSLSNPPLVIGGTLTQQHIEIDNNEILAKLASSTNNVPGNLYLNDPLGGSVFVGCALAAGNTTTDQRVATCGWVSDATKSTNVVHRDSVETITGTKTFSNVLTTKSGVNAQYIELTAGTPYIDFHYNNTTSDYTSRIIAGSSGVLTINQKSIPWSDVAAGSNDNTIATTKWVSTSYLSTNVVHRDSTETISGTKNFSNITVNHVDRTGIDTTWIGGRDYSILRMTSTITNGNWTPAISIRALDGYWSIGTLSNDKGLYFSKDTDANYDDKKNETTRIYMPEKSGTIAVTSDIPTSPKGYWSMSGQAVTSCGSINLKKIASIACLSYPSNVQIYATNTFYKKNISNIYSASVGNYSASIGCSLNEGTESLYSGTISNLYAQGEVNNDFIKVYISNAYVTLGILFY